MAKRRYPKDWESKYTDPDLRARLKDEVTAGDRGGRPGQWSARKAQLLTATYERDGGGYRGPKDATQQHLSQWTQEDWQTSDGQATARTGAEDEHGGASRRYLPKQAWDRLSKADRQVADQTKAAGSAGGEQYVPNPDSAADAGRTARDHSAGLPIAGYDDLKAKDATKALGALTDADQVQQVAAYEQAHRSRKTVLDRARSLHRRLTCTST